MNSSIDGPTNKSDYTKDYSQRGFTKLSVDYIDCTVKRNKVNINLNI
jgi:hypothetical protein